jgi:heme exporter protein D
VGLDGYWLLADAVREPDLDHRSRSALWCLTRRRDRADRIRVDDVALAGYAALNAIVAAVLLVTALFFWYETFGNLLAQVTGLGAVGWLAVGAALAVLAGPVVRGLRPHAEMVLDVTRRVAARLRFRAQRRWRVRATEELLALGALAHLDELGLGVVAGALDRVRIRRGDAYRQADFVGLVLAIPRGTQRAETWRTDHGVAVAPRRCLELFLLPQAALAAAA